MLNQRRASGRLSGSPLLSYRFVGGVVVAAAVSVLAPGCDETFPAPLETPPPVVRFDVRPSNTTCRAEVLPVGPVKLEPVYEGLDRPLRMVDRPDRGLLYVAEMPGRVKVIDKDTGVISVALDLVGKVVDDQDQGLFGLAIHPTKPFAYVVVDRKSDATSLKDLPARSEILRFAISADGKTLDPASEKLVIRIDRYSALHSAGTAEFGPDGLLYLGAGDGGRPDSFHPKDKLVGSVLRLDVDKAEPYAIPDGNPFAKGGGAPEVYAFGFRNPWRFSFDKVTGEMWLGDVGENVFEELDKIEVGKNYGWPVFEGTRCTKRDPTCPTAGLVPPVFEYPHSEGGSITGGYIYRGKVLTDFVGKYVYADFTAGHLRAIDPTVKDPKVTFLNPGGPKPMMAGLAEDAQGELYALGWSDGKIYRMVKGDAESKPTFPALLSQTGCAEGAKGLVPYGVNMELWSDGAQKRRFLAIPDGTVLHATPEGHLDIPKGGVAVKEFAIDGKRIETRLLRHHPDDTWSGSTYEWNDAQTDATLLETAKEKKLANGQVWSFPSPIQCFTCHKEAAGFSLGTEVVQFNRDFDYAPGQRTNQLTTLADIGYVDVRLEPGKTPRLPELESGAPVEDRARGYLHANCSICHREGGGTGAIMDFRFGQPFSAIKGCQQAGNSGGRGTFLLVAGEPQESVIYNRMTSRGEQGYGPMPALATNVVDDAAAKVLAAWITSLAKCE